MGLLLNVKWIMFDTIYLCAGGGFYGGERASKTANNALLSLISIISSSFTLN